MKSSSNKLVPGKVIPGEDATHLNKWSPPDVSDPAQVHSLGAHEAPPLPTAAELEALQKQAREEGYEEGRKEGFEYGHREAREELRAKVQAQLGQLDILMQALNKPFLELDDQVEQEVVTLVISMVRQLVRREVKMDPNHIIGVVREALSILPVASRNVRLVLHPEDAELVREVYSLTDAEPGWQIVEDPVLARGGCRVLTDTSQVDATLESRLNALIAPLLAAERSEDADEDDEVSP